MLCFLRKKTGLTQAASSEKSCLTEQHTHKETNRDLGSSRSATRNILFETGLYLQIYFIVLQKTGSVVPHRHIVLIAAFKQFDINAIPCFRLTIVHPGMLHIW